MKPCFKHSQWGYATLYVVLIIASLLLLGSGYIIYRHRQADRQTRTATARGEETNLLYYTDTSGSFSFVYPTTWRLDYARDQGKDGSTPQTTDWSKTPRPIQLTNTTLIRSTVDVRAYANTNTTIDSIIAAGDKDRFNTYSRVTVHGYPAVKHTLQFIGPDQAESYTDIAYTVLHDKTEVNFSFRQFYHNATTTQTDDFDASKLTPQFEAMVQSLRFK